MINKSFIAYITINDEEFRCDVQASGFLHEKNNKVSDVEIDEIYNLETDQYESFEALDKSEQESLTLLAKDYLEDTDYEEHNEVI